MLRPPVVALLKHGTRTPCAPDVTVICMFAAARAFANLVRFPVTFMPLRAVHAFVLIRRTTGSSNHMPDGDVLVCMAVVIHTCNGCRCGRDAYKVQKRQNIQNIMQACDIQKVPRSAARATI